MGAKRWFVAWTTGIALAVGMAWPTVFAAPAGGTPWWDDFPTVVQTNDAGKSAASHATVALCGAADDCAWGIWGQRIRVAEAGKPMTDAIHAAGLKALSWVEGFGTPNCYVVQIKRNSDGSWVKWPGTDLTRVFRNAWGWSAFDGTGEAQWVGIHTYWDDIDYARPYTRTHPRYGCPPMTYPDGRVAAGFDGPATDPRNSRIFDAGCSKNVLGDAWGADRGKLIITDALRGAKAPAEGAPGNAPTVVPDPGFTPAEWAERTRKTGALLHLGAEKDSACPLWIDYARAEVRLALDTGVDGLWVDNFSPWDSLNAAPIHHAFGEWSVARFRDHLRAHFAPAALAAMGVTDLKGFDVRQYLQARVKEWGGSPQDLKGAHWKDARWQDDPIWRAYLIHKRQVGTEALSNLYRVFKEEAAAAGKPDFLVMGNDIPAFSLGWPRGDLDMVSTELTWGWWLATGPRGIMPPPLGCYVPVYKLAREHARSRFVNTWPYAANEVKGKPTIADVVHYQGLATHTLPMPQYSDHTMGTEASNAAFFAFVRQAAPVFGRRLPVEEIGLYYSSSSELVGMLPAWYREHNNQGHIFSFWGWGTALTWLHVPWRAVPEWKLTPETLAALRVLIIPNAEVFPAEDVPILEKWVRGGGVLITAGECGRRSGEADNFDRCRSGSTLDALVGSALKESPRAMGKGRVFVLPEDPGLPFYQADKARPEMLPAFGKRLATVGAGPGSLSLSAPEVPWKVGLTLYRDGGRLFVDVNNTDVDLAKDQVAAAPPVQFSVALPAALRGKKLSARVLSPEAPPPLVQLMPAGAGRVLVKLGAVRLYASVVIEASGSGR